MADRHYSRQTIGAAEFMGPGRAFVMLAERAVWGVNENLDTAGNMRWRCTIFRNESQVLSSLLVIEATERTHAYWRRHYGALPSAHLTTEVNVDLVKRKRDPGRCFIRAGWSLVGETTKGLLVFQAPASARVGNGAEAHSSASTTGSGGFSASCSRSACE